MAQRRRARPATPRTRASRRSAVPPLDAVRLCLQTYADRGVFRGFSEKPPQAGQHRFRFLWLARKPFELRYEPSTGTFTFHNLLPNVPVRSTLYSELKEFIERRTSSRLPAHRRVDPRRATLACSNTRARLSVHLIAKRHHHVYGVNRVVNLVHEIFLYLHGYRPEYMWENFDVAEE